MTSQPTTRHSLLLRLRDVDDKQAWNEFFEIYQPLIYRLARARGVQEAEAHDVTQEVLMAVAGSIEQFESRPQRGSFRGWLATITRNTTINRLRSLETRPLLQASDSNRWEESLVGDAAVDQVAQREFEYERRRQVFLWAAEQLRTRFQTRNWQAFWLTCVEGQGVDVVAEKLGMSAGAVYVARCRVIARLREIVELKTGE